MYGEEQGDGPQPDCYVIGNIAGGIQSGRYNNLLSPWFSWLGFYFGMVHGGVLSLQTGQLRPDVSTLVLRNAIRNITSERIGKVTLKGCFCDKWCNLDFQEAMYLRDEVVMLIL